MILLVSVAGTAQNCEDKTLTSYYQQMQEHIKRFEFNLAISFSDSINRLINNKGLGNCEMAQWILLDRGEAFELGTDFEAALKLYQDIVRKAERNSWVKLLAHAHISIARCYEKIDRKNQSLFELIEARKIITQYQLDTVYARFCLRYSSYHRVFDNKDSAKIYALKSIELGQKYQVQRSVFDGHLLMGMLSDDVDSSVFHFQQAVNMFVERGDYNGAASQCINITARLFREGRLKEAMETIEQCSFYSTKMVDHSKNYYKVLSGIHRQRAIIYEKMGKIDSAYYHQGLSHENDKKADYEVNQESITTIAIEYAVEKEKEKAIYLRRISGILWWALGIMTLSVIIFIGLFINNRKKRDEINKQNKLIQIQNARLEESLDKQSMLLSEVHHRVKNNLQLIISLLTLQGHDSNSKVLNQLLEDVSSKVMGIALIHEQLYSTGEFEDINIKIYLENLIFHFNSFQSGKDEFDSNIEINDIYLNLETVMPIGIICTELIGNSLKYAKLPEQKLSIKISLHSFDNSFVFKYADNGPGIVDKTQKRNKSRMGLILINNMVRQLQAESTMYFDEGANFNMIFKEKKVSQI